MTTQKLIKSNGESIVASLREKTHEMYFPYAEMSLVCEQIVSKCIEILQIYVRMEFAFLYVETELRIPGSFSCLFEQDAENTRC